MTTMTNGSVHRRAMLGLALGTVLALVGCGPADDDPYVAFDGGGFVFNYRIAEAFYGFNLKPMRALSPGTVLEASLEDPAGGAPIMIAQTVAGPQLRYTFRTGALTGIRAKRPYTVEVRVREAGSGKVLATYRKSFESELDQADLPSKPLVVGPGYAPNPEIPKAP